MCGWKSSFWQSRPWLPYDDNRQWRSMRQREQQQRPGVRSRRSIEELLLANCAESKEKGVLIEDRWDTRIPTLVQKENLSKTMRRDDLIPAWDDSIRCETKRSGARRGDPGARRCDTARYRTIRVRYGPIPVRDGSIPVPETVYAEVLQRRGARPGLQPARLATRGVWGEDTTTRSVVFGESLSRQLAFEIFHKLPP